MLLKSIFIVLLFFGTLFVSLDYLIKKNEKKKIIYRFIPSTSDNFLYEDNAKISDIFEELFNTGSPWFENHKMKEEI